MQLRETEDKFTRIQEKMERELVGQKSYIEKLCSYFKGKICGNHGGCILLKGERGTFKKVSIKLMFEILYAENLVKNGEVEELNLGEYDYNLGYNAFLTDLYEKLNSSGDVLLFKNIEKASKDILNIISNIYPGSCLILNDDYVLRNKFLIEAVEETGKINKFTCGNKFFVFVYNDDSGKIEDTIFKNAEETFHTKPLTDKERNIVLRNELLRSIHELQNTTGIDIQLGVHGEDDSEDILGVCSFLQGNYKETSNFGINDYISYKVYKPLLNLINKEKIDTAGQLLIFARDNELFCKVDKNIYKISDYLIPTLEEARYKLNSIIGIRELKDYVQKVENNYKVQRIREKLGLKTSNISMNMIFTGNAGTGKTNAARITFEYLNALGIIKKNIFNEVSKVDFVAGNLNDTAEKTMEIINSSLGGVLFIDEAYSLCEGEDDKTGKEIVETLLKGIEDNRDNLIVIMAGYEKDMERFLSVNQGLKSRFPNTIHFYDYNPVEMYEIAVNIAKSKGYRISKSARTGLIDLFTRNQLTGKNDLGNARFVRNIVENAIMDASKKYLINDERQIDLLERDNFNFRVNAKFDLEEKLRDIVGLDEVKELIRNQYKLIVAQEKRKSVGVTTKIEQNLNMVFTGNPGTGKTSMARLIAEMLNSMGLLKIGQLVETDRSSFVSEIPGETARKTEAKFKEAIGGVLFIDEAYTLANDSVGIQVIETLLKLIEDHAGEVVVILAGYTEDMESFFDVNIGLRSRFPLWTNFADYNPRELLEMAIKLVEAKGFKLSKGGYETLRKSFIDIYENSDAQSGNGRMVRNYVEKLIRNQSIRIAEQDISEYEMNLITARDVENLTIDVYDSDFNLEKRLEVLVGSEKSKEFLRDQYKILKVRDRRRRLGFKNDLNKYMNIVFTGENGTGKKTVANIYSEMLYSMGIVKGKNIVEIDIYEIISAVNNGISLEDILGKHLGKVMFIDKMDFLREHTQNNKIIGELIKFIDKNSNRCVMIISGTRSRMRDFILLNEALNYRFTTWFDFEDYNYSGLCNIAVSTLRDRGYVIDHQAEDILNKAIIHMYGNPNIVLKNGLMIKQFLDILTRIQSIRISSEILSREVLCTITCEDVERAENEFMIKNHKNK